MSYDGHYCVDLGSFVPVFSSLVRKICVVEKNDWGHDWGHDWGQAWHFGIFKNFLH